MLSGYKQPLNISRYVQPLSILSGMYNNLKNISMGVQTLSMLSGCTTIFSNVSRVYNLYQCYQGVQSLSILSECTTLSILLGCTTFINIIRGIQQPLSILVGMYNLYQY